jgi:multicomponent Na+:H+ antiporter subunit D
MNEHLPALAFLLPLACAFVMPVLEILSERAARILAALGSVAHLVVAFYLFLHTGNHPVVYRMGGWPAQLGICFAVDRAGAGFFLLVVAICCGLAFYSLGYLKRPLRRYYVLYYLMLAGLSGFILTGDAFNFYVFMELLSLAAYGLVAVMGDRKGVLAALKYMLYGTIAGVLVLMGVIFLYRFGGTLNMAELSRVIPGLAPRIKATLLALLLVGLGLKLAIMPFHLWLPDAHAGAPAPVSALLSGALVMVWLFGMLRLLFTVLGPGVLAEKGVPGLLMAAGCFSIITGHLMAFAQQDIKRMLSYSTLAHVGYMLVGVGIATPAGIGAAMFHALNHAIMKGCLFMLAGVLIATTGRRRISDLRGAARYRPWVCALFFVPVIAIIGLPPMNGFFSKFFLAAAAVKVGHPMAAAAIPLGTVLSALYFMRLLKIFYSAPETPWETPEPGWQPGWPAYAVAVAFAAACLLLGLLSATAWPFFRQVGDVLLDREGYVHAVIGTGM